MGHDVGRRQKLLELSHTNRISPSLLAMKIVSDHKKPEIKSAAVASIATTALAEVPKVGTKSNYIIRGPFDTRAERRGIIPPLTSQPTFTQWKMSQIMRRQVHGRRRSGNSHAYKKSSCARKNNSLQN